MSATLTPTPRPTVTRPGAAGRRVGYVVAIVVNAVLLWIAHQLLDWGWPRFLTDAFDDLLGLVTVSFVANMLVYAVYLVRDHGRVRALGEMVTAAFALVVSLRTWDVFPFDFSGYATNWSWVPRTFLVIAIVGSAIGLLVHGVRLVNGRDGPTG